MRGVFRFYHADGSFVDVPNIVPNEGEEAYLQILMQGDDTLVPLGVGNYYVGLITDETVYETDTLATITELTETGYARIALGRNATDWPTVAGVGGDFYAESKTITFNADPAGWAVGFRRAILCNVASGTTGKLLAISGAYAQPKILGPSEAFAMRYTLYLE